MIKLERKQKTTAFFSLLILLFLFSFTFGWKISQNFARNQPKAESYIDEENSNVKRVSEIALTGRVEFYDTTVSVEKWAGKEYPKTFRIDDISYKIEGGNRSGSYKTFPLPTLPVLPASSPNNYYEYEIKENLNEILASEKNINIRVRIKGVALENNGKTVMFNGVMTEPVFGPCVSYQEKKITADDSGIIVIDPIQFYWEGPGCKPWNYPPDDFNPPKYGKVLRANISFSNGYPWEQYYRRAFRIDEISYQISSSKNQETSRVEIPQRYKSLAVTAAVDSFLLRQPILVRMDEGNIFYTLQLTGTAMENYTQNEKLQIYEQWGGTNKKCILTKTVPATIVDNEIDFGDFGVDWNSQDCR